MRALIARATFAVGLCLGTQVVLGNTVEVYQPPAEAVATAHPVATQAGLEVLAEGGNAFDAAVAVAATLAVVEPYGSGIGGGGFFLLHRNVADMDVMVDARETAPGAATGDMYLDANGEPVPDLSRDGPLASGIPGIPAALDHITKSFGVRSIEQNLQPAIRAARGGFPVSEELAGRITASAHRFSPAASQVFLPNGKLPSVGDILKQEDLARTLEQIAKKGRDGFYKGPVAKKLQAGAFRDGGIWSLDDLAGYRIKEREPTKVSYRGYEITTASLPSAGGVTISQILNILKARDWPPAGDTAARHELIEAMRLAYRDRAIYLGDPDFVDVPVARLTSESYAGELAARIGPKALDSSDMEIASEQAARASDQNTTHFSILDKDGNRVSATLSINTWFGSGYMAPGTGVLLNNEMDDFATAPLVPNAYGLVHTEANAIQPHKRPLSSMSPTFVEGPRGVFITGTPGGSRIITMVLLSSLAHMHGLSAQQAVNAPRFHHQFLPDTVYFEPSAFTQQQQAALQARGHALSSSSRRYGNMQAIHWNIRHDTVEAASDPRGIGSADVRATRED